GCNASRRRIRPISTRVVVSENESRVKREVRIDTREDVAIRILKQRLVAAADIREAVLGAHNARHPIDSTSGNRRVRRSTVGTDLRIPLLLILHAEEKEKAILQDRPADPRPRPLRGK